MKASIIIPVYNDAAAISTTLSGLCRYLGQEYEIIVVDDYSTDSTPEVVRGVISGHDNARLIANGFPKGFANALRSGFEAARGGILVPVMADHCDDAALIPRLCAKVSEGYDIVCASRYCRGGSRSGGSSAKAFFSAANSRLMCLFAHFPTTDCSNSFRAYRREVVEAVRVESTGFEVSMELVVKAHRAGRRIAEIPTQWHERTEGHSHFALAWNGVKYVKWFLMGLSGRKGEKAWP